MTRKKFIRSGYHRYSKLGLRRKKKQVYRKAKGGDNKVRLNRAGRIRKVKIGFRSRKTERGLIKGLKGILVHNIEDLKKIKHGEIGIIAKIGNKKRLEIAKYALEKNIPLKNLDSKEFIEKIEKKRLKIKEDKKKKLDKKKQKNEKLKRKEKDEKKIEMNKEERKLDEKIEEKKDKIKEKSEEKNNEKSKRMDKEKENKEDIGNNEDEDDE